MSETTAAPPPACPPAVPATPEQSREAPRSLASVLNGCPVADDAILCVSELAANSCVHSASGQAGGTFTVRAEIHQGDYVWIEVEDSGGPWNQAAPPHRADHTHAEYG